MLEDDVRIAIDNFNRFRRPKVMARLISVEKNIATVEFTGTEEIGDIKYLSDTLRNGIEFIVKSPVTAEPRKKGNTCISKYTVAGETNPEENPMERALKIMDNYNEGTTPEKFGFED